jgi:hypothetical protein
MEPDAEKRSKVTEKLSKIIDRGYVTLGAVTCLSGFHAVKKGLKDFRLVYDASKCGVNSCVWAPNFGLPTVDSVLSCIS